MRRSEIPRHDDEHIHFLWRDVQTPKERPAEILVVVGKDTFVNGDKEVDSRFVSYMDQFRCVGEYRVLGHAC